jgi:predicted phage terminase large subunit-like protein
MSKNTTLNKTREQLLKLYEEKRRVMARTSFMRFVTYTYEGYEMVWFHKCVCAYLDALYRGDIKKLMIFMPPQHGKSELSSRRFPAYVLGRDPGLKVALTSYSQDLASRFNSDVQKVMQAPSYLDLYPNTEISKSVANSKIFEIEGERGILKTVGVGGGLTGNPVDIGIIDDPFKDRMEANSATYRNRTWDWYQDVFCTRLHNDSKQLMLFTRWHEDDLAGRILDPKNPCYDAQEASEWTVLALPALKEVTKPLSCAIDLQDPREVGEALWENRHSRKKYEKRKRINPTGFASLDQQRPSAEEGNKIKGEWFNVIKPKEVPFNMEQVRWDCFIDGAWTDKVQNDPTAVLYSYFDKAANILYIRNVQEVRKELYKFLEFFGGAATANGITKKSKIYIELKASGRAFKTFLDKAHYNCIAINNKTVSYGKINRVENAEPFLASGKVVLIQTGNYIESFIEQCKAFPNGTHDDMVDCLTYAVDQYFIKGKPKRVFYD